MQRRRFGSCLSRSHFAAGRIQLEHRFMKAADNPIGWIPVLVRLHQRPSQIPHLLYFVAQKVRVAQQIGETGKHLRLRPAHEIDEIPPVRAQCQQPLERPPDTGIRSVRPTLKICDLAVDPGIVVLAARAFPSLTQKEKAVPLIDTLLVLRPRPASWIVSAQTRENVLEWRRTDALAPPAQSPAWPPNWLAGRVSRSRSQAPASRADSLAARIR
jgi:hypothetical protein